MEWFHFACVGIDPKAKPKGSWFCESCRLRKGPSRRLAVVVQRAMQVILVGDVAGSI